MRHAILDADRLRAMRPLIRRIVDDLIHAFGEVLEAARRGDDCMGPELDRMQAYVFELEQLGGTVRSMDPMRIEFMAEQGGRLGYLPWCPRAQDILPFEAMDALCAVA